jgi:hypothetical protein
MPGVHTPAVPSGAVAGCPAGPDARILGGRCRGRGGERARSPNPGRCTSLVGSRTGTTDPLLWRSSAGADGAPIVDEQHCRPVLLLVARGGGRDRWVSMLASLREGASDAFLRRGEARPTRMSEMFKTVVRFGGTVGA